MTDVVSDEIDQAGRAAPQTLALVERVRRNQRKQQEKQRALNGGNPEPVQLSFLPEGSPGSRAFPNSFARSSLFSAKKDGARDHHENKHIATFANLEIEYSGSELRQDDASVLMTLFYLGRELPAGEPIHLTPYALLKELSWTINGREYEHLRECCVRLSATAITVREKGERKGYNGSLIRKFQWQKDETDETGASLEYWVLWLEPEVVHLFTKTAFTLLDWEERKDIGSRAKLALWLHTFYMTHAEPIDLSVELYYKLTDSGMRELSDFRRSLRSALTKLQSVGFLVHWEIKKNDMVHVKRRAPKKFAVVKDARTITETKEAKAKSG